jgi:hypothetical protein
MVSFRVMVTGGGGVQCVVSRDYGARAHDGNLGRRQGGDRNGGGGG